MMKRQVHSFLKAIIDKGEYTDKSAYGNILVEYKEPINLRISQWGMFGGTVIYFDIKRVYMVPYTMVLVDKDEKFIDILELGNIQGIERYVP